MANGGRDDVPNRARSSDAVGGRGPHVPTMTGMRVVPVVPQ